MRFKIEIDREGCIACGTCYTVDPAHFESDVDGRSKVVGGKSNGKSTGSFDDENIEDAKSAAESCPASVIMVSEI